LFKRLTPNVRSVFSTNVSYCGSTPILVESQRAPTAQAAMMTMMTNPWIFSHPKTVRFWQTLSKKAQNQQRCDQNEQERAF
jgi:hypothetical protein